jgi:uncharacterized protein HemY
MHAPATYLRWLLVRQAPARGLARGRRGNGSNHYLAHKEGRRAVSIITILIIIILALIAIYLVRRVI